MAEGQVFPKDTKQTRDGVVVINYSCCNCMQKVYARLSVLMVNNRVYLVSQEARFVGNIQNDAQDMYISIYIYFYLMEWCSHKKYFE